MRRVTALAILAALVLSACAFLGSGEARTYRATFTRAVQVFPGGKVRVLGVDVGLIRDVRNVPGGVELELTIDDPEVKLPADVQAAIIPVSLLGERYVQLFPAYQGGPVLEEGAMIPMERTAVPSEPDELLRSLQDYLGALDPQTVSAFVTSAAALVEGQGETLNSLLRHGAETLATLSAKRDDLAEIIVQFDRLSRALVTRKEALARLIHSYNAVVGTLTSNRTAVEGSITGLNEMAVELATLLVSHRKPLHKDIKTLTRTGRTLTKNVDTLAESGFWAQRLFRVASHAVDTEADWLRLNNQGAELERLILQRIEDRLIELCVDLGLPICATPRYWAAEVPTMFCFEDKCPGLPAPRPDEQPGQQLAEAIQEVPELADALLEQAQDIVCQNAKDPEACKRRKKILTKCANAANAEQCLEENAALLSCLKAPDVKACLEDKQGEDVQQIVDDLIEDTIGGVIDDLPGGDLPGDIPGVGDQP